MMENTQPNTLVIKDQAGDYYLLALETLQQGRIPEEQRADVERLVDEADTSGFVAPWVVYYGVKLVTIGIAYGAYRIADAIGGEEVNILEGIKSPKPQ